MSDTYRGGSHAAHAQYSSTYERTSYTGSPYVHPAHGGPTPPPGPESFGAPPAYGTVPGQQGSAPHQPEARRPLVAQGSAFGRVLHGAGALLSVALIAGLAVWGYKLALRDVTGVPVVRALEGPMRIQPEDPGGVAAAHQGLAVNAIAAAGQAEGPAEQVALAPAPASLSADDNPAVPGTTVSAVSAAEADETLAPAPAMASVLEVVQAAAEAATGAAEAAAAPAPSRSAGAVPANVPGVVRSPRPAPRPEDVVARAAASPVEIALASASVAAAPAVREVAAGQVPVGTRLVQLGAYDSVEVARAAWTELSSRFEEILEGKDRVIEKAQSGGKTFYRLRAMGFADLSDARRFCSALAAGQAACIPVVTR